VPVAGSGTAGRLPPSVSETAPGYRLVPCTCAASPNSMLSPEANEFATSDSSVSPVKVKLATGSTPLPREPAPLPKWMPKSKALPDPPRTPLAAASRYSVAGALVDPIRTE
jgi:hypothetical protein